MSKTPPSIASALFTLVGVTLRRFSRGRAVWAVVPIALLPVLFASFVHDPDAIKGPQLLIMGLLPPVFVASAIGEEIEDRTSTYLWSRPLPRWTLLVGKLLALAPLATLLIVGGWFLAVQVGVGHAPAARSILAFGAGALAVCAMAAGIGTLVPKHGMALSLIYFFVIDLAVGAIPAPVRQISITYHVRSLGAFDSPNAIAQRAITMSIVAAIWLAIALWRLRRLEA
jgi:ABC-type transport system involved in multi-copper enzyme maturation permease subunit